MPVRDWLSARCFGLVHRHNLVYNTCWEDPRVDRQALNLGPDDTVAMITSAGCNALDYALLEPRGILCIDVNPRQNALLELKLAGIRRLDFATFFALFGRGRLRNVGEVYRQQLRAELSNPARKFWDRKIDYFAGTSARSSFYFRGAAGALAFLINTYIDHIARVRDSIEALLDAGSLAEQRAVYSSGLHAAFWSGFLRWAMDRDATLAMLGVPPAQRQQVERTYPGGIARFIEDRLEEVFTELPIHDNYFWRVYITGRYSPTCCPEYLKEHNFLKLKAGLVDRIHPFTGTLLNFLHLYEGRISRFVLLDHMDWLSTRPDLLARQWQALLARAAANTRVLWRSGGLKVDFLDSLAVRVNGRDRHLGDVLDYQTELATNLHRQDRVNTYGSFYVADLLCS